MRRKMKKILSVFLAVMVLLPAMMAGTASPAKAAPNGIVKYAVSVYDIGKDIDEYGDPMGLTFGPALGENYVKSFKSHEPTGETDKGNQHRCVHNDDWETIIMWNFIDPYVYEQCIGQGCTHSVGLDLNKAETLLNPEFDSSYTTGDGPSILYYEMMPTSSNYENLRWNPKTEGGASDDGTNKLGWGATRIRAMLNGRDELDVLGSEYTSTASSDPNKDYSIYTSANCLLNAFPEELKAAIGKKAVKYDSVHNSKTEANLKTSYDKLWLLSPNEIWTTSQNTNSDYMHPLEGTQYTYFASYAERGKTMTRSTDSQTATVGYLVRNRNGNNSGTADFWWLRSSYSNVTVSNDFTNALCVYRKGSVYFGSAYYYGVAPCFALSGNSEGSVKLMLDTNGGYTENSIIKSETTSVTVPEALRPGYYLTGWNTAKDGSGTMHQPGDTINASLGDVIFLYAQWETAPTYQVKHFQQNIDETGYDLVETETLYGAPNRPSTPEPKTYDGFITPEAQTIVVNEDSSSVVEYHYDRTRYTVHFDANGGDGVMADQPMIGAMNARLYDNQYTKENAIFSGWNTKQDGSGISYGDAQTVTNLAGNNETATLYAQWIDTAGSTAEPTAGTYVLTLKRGQTIRIPNLPAGTRYSLKEVNLPFGWSIKYESGTEGTIQPAETSEAVVTNEYSAKGTVSLVAYKTTNTEEIEQGAYTFQLLSGSTVLQTVTNGPIDLQEEVLSANGQSVIKNPYYGMSVIRFDDITLDTVGTKTYTIKEVAGSDETMQYDTHTENVTVRTTDNGNGTLTATVTYDGDGPVFTNIKIPKIEDEDKTGKLEIGKTVVNANSDKGFNFKVTLLDDYGTEVSGSFNADVVKTANKGNYKDEERIEYSAVSHTQNLDDSGTKLSNYGNSWSNSHIRGTGRESAASQAHVITFPGAKNMHVKLTYGGESERYDYVAMWAGNHPNYTAYSNSGSSVTGRLGGGYATNASNTKEYDVPGDSVTFSYRSDGSGCGDGYGYYAVVTAEVNNITYKDGFVRNETISSGDTITLKSGETAVIEGIPAGVHYKVEEVPADGYELVSFENTEGVIAEEQTSSASFENVYVANGEIELNLTKSFPGYEFKGGDFTFRLMDANGNLLEEVTNDEEGHITFSPISYTEEDIGKRIGYSVQEVIPETKIPNVIYDEHIENIVVSVEDAGNGVLNPVAEYRDGGVINNAYDVSTLTISKTVTGNMGSKDKAFTVQITLENNGVPLSGTFPCSGTDINEITFTNGVGTCLLKHQDTITIENITIGTDYAVEELHYKPYTPTIQGGEGKIGPNGSVVAIENNLVKDIPTMVHIHGWKAAIVLLGVALAGIIMLKKRNSKNTI